MATTTERAIEATPGTTKSYGGLSKIPDEILLERYGLFRDELDALKQTIAPQASDYDLLIFLATARRLGLDVLVPGMMQLMKFEGKTGTRWVTNIGFRGELALAEATGELLGHEEWVEYDDHQNPIKASCKVYRKGWPKPFTDSVSLDEAKNDRNPLWEDRPETMLKNAAIKRAVSMAFPKRFSQFRAGILAEAGVEQLAPGQKGTGLSIAGEHHEPAALAPGGPTRSEIPAAPARQPVTVEARLIPPSESAPAAHTGNAAVGKPLPSPEGTGAGDKTAGTQRSAEQGAGKTPADIEALAKSISEIMDDPGLTQEQRARMWELLNVRLDARKLDSTWQAKPEDYPFVMALRDDLQQIHDRP